MYMYIFNILALVIFVGIMFRYFKIYDAYKSQNGKVCKPYSKKYFYLLILIEVLLSLVAFILIPFNSTIANFLLLISISLFQLFFVMKTDNGLYTGYNPINFDTIRKVDLVKISDSKYTISILYKNYNSRIIKLSNEALAYELYDLLLKKSLNNSFVKA